MIHRIVNELSLIYNPIQDVGLVDVRYLVEQETVFVGDIMPPFGLSDPLRDISVTKSPTITTTTSAITTPVRLRGNGG